MSKGNGKKEGGREIIVNRQTPQRYRESSVQMEEKKFGSELVKLTLAVSCLLIKALIWKVKSMACVVIKYLSQRQHYQAVECPQSFT